LQGLRFEPYSKHWLVLGFDSFGYLDQFPGWIICLVVLDIEGLAGGSVSLYIIE